MMDFRESEDACENRSFMRGGIWFFLYGVLGVQFVLVIAWMFLNIGTKPTFGDATEYLNLSKTLLVDEYRPILYPIFIRMARGLELIAHIPYCFYVYVVQATVSFFCIRFAVRVVDELFLNRFYSDGRCGVGLLHATAYIWTFPLVGFMSFAGMSDSIALSMTLLFLSGLLVVFNRVDVGWRPYGLIAVAYCLGSLVRGDRPYLFLAFGIVAAIVVCVLRKRLRMRSVVLVATLFMSFAAVMTVNRFTQKPGCRNRPRTTFAFVLLDRVVWPHMSECYMEFPPEVRSVVSRKDAENFDANNNNVMYVFARNMNRRLGEDRAHELYKIMAKTIFRVRTKRVLYEISHDIAKVCLSPFFQTAEVYNVNCHKGHPCINPYCYNPRCFMTNTKWLTWAANAIPLHLFVVLLLWFLFKALRHPDSRTAMRGALPVLLTYFGFSLTLALFYSIGDGAHPNSRYSIIVDCSWCMLALVSIAMVGSNGRLPREVHGCERSKSQ